MAEVRTMDSIQNNTEGMDEIEAKVYEISFHIVPTLGEANIKAEFDGVKKIISDLKDTTFISEGLPVLKTLSYQLSKTVKAVKSNYTQAYFGWVKFTANPDQIETIKLAVNEMPTIIRFLIISTVKENTMINKQEGDKGEKGEEEEKHVIAEDIDKTIDELVV